MHEKENVIKAQKRYPECVVETKATNQILCSTDDLEIQ